MGMLQMQMNMFARYSNVFILAYLFRGGPIPGNRQGLIACAICTLTCNVLLHVYVTITRNFRLVGYLLLGLDIMTVLPAVYCTGMVASPFIVLIPMSLFSAFFINRNARVTVMFGLTAVLAFVALTAWWWLSGANASGWNPRVYPAFTMFAFLVEALALSVATYQASFLPNPIVEELREKEAFLVQHSKSAELGLSLAMVVHELRNPLTSVGAGLEIAEEALQRSNKPVPDSVMQSVSRGLKEMERVRRMLENLMAFARDRHQATRREPTQLREVVDSAMEFIQLKYGRDRVKFSVSEQPPRLEVLGDRDTLYQVVVNLFNNAVTAEVPGRGLAIDVYMSTKDVMHEMLIRDNGCGMSPELAARIFSPFVTTRHTGTGLGMPIVVQILKDHGGTIDLTSTEGAGTTIRLLLPVHQASAAAHAQAAVAAAAVVRAADVPRSAAQRKAAQTSRRLTSADHL